jgi:acyl carrier protein
MKKIDSAEIRDVMSQTFANSKIPDLIDDLKIGDLVEWDSLGNFNFLLALEERFGVHFDLEQIANLKSIRDMRAAIEAK